MKYELVPCPHCRGCGRVNLGAEVTGYTLNGPTIEDSYSSCGACTNGQVLKLSYDEDTYAYNSMKDSYALFAPPDEAMDEDMFKLEYDFQNATWFYFQNYREEVTAEVQRKIDYLRNNDGPNEVFTIEDDMYVERYDLAYGGETTRYPLWLFAAKDIRDLLIKESRYA